MLLDEADKIIRSYTPVSQKFGCSVVVPFEKQGQQR
jgi:hypothetical protein